MKKSAKKNDLDEKKAGKKKEPKELKVKLGRRFNRAFEFAAKKHGTQTRKASTIPYVAHLLGVASLVLEAGGDEDLAIAALLHDVVEDCGGKPMLKKIRHKFGKRVAQVVDGCTDAYATPKPPWKERKVAYLKRLQHEDDGTRLVSAADKLHNARSIVADYREIGDAIWERFNGKREGTLWYYRAMVDEFMKRKPNRVSRDLDLVVNEMEALSQARKPAVRG